MERTLTRLLVLLAVLGDRAAPAGNGVWTSNGPDGGSIPTVAASGGIVLAGTNGGGLYRSTDSGVSWAPVPTLKGFVKHVAFSNAQGVAYASSGGTFHKSTDAGASWFLSNTGLSGTIYSISRLPGDEIFVGTETNGLYRSTNLGATFEKMTFTANFVSSVVLESSTSSLFAGSAGGNGGGAHKSTDGGQTWTQVNSGLTDGVANPQTIVGLASTGGTVWAALQTTPNAIRRSTDSGVSWQAASTGLPSRIARGVWVSPVTPTVLHATLDFPEGGHYRSTDSGGTWATAHAGLTNRRVNHLALSPNGNHAATDGSGVFNSADGVAWSRSNIGLRAVLVYSLRSYVNGEVLAATDAGLHRSRDAGLTWTLLENGVVDRFGSAPKVNDVVVKGGIHIATTGGYFRSDNDGASFAAFNEGIEDGGGNAVNVRLLGVDPIEIPVLLYAATGLGPARSLDTGSNWSPMADTDITGKFVSDFVIGTDGVGFAGTQSGVVRTIDDGATWETSNTGLGNLSITAIQSNDPAWPEHVTVSTTGGLWRSTDNASSWAPLNTLLTSANDLSIAPSRAATLYVSRGFPLGLYVSTNGGSSFTQKNDGLDTLFAAFQTPGAVAADGEVSTRAYAAVAGAGVFTIDLIGNGDANGDGVTNVGDVFYLIGNLFAAGAPPVGTGDANGDGATNVADVFYLINHLFAAGPPPH